ncbi:HAAS signaling domain-containing protein [Paenibacillus tarimensis]
MGELNRLLTIVPEHQRAEWLYDYELHFRMAAENGIPEEQAAAELGDPRLIAKELLLGYRVHQAEDNSTVVSVSRAVFATVGLGFFNLVFVLGPFIAVLGVLIALWAVSGALLLVAAACIWEGYRGEMFSLPQGFSLAAVSCGLGLLSGAGTLSLSRGFFSMTLKYLRFNTRLVRGGRA